MKFNINTSESRFKDWVLRNLSNQTKYLKFTIGSIQVNTSATIKIEGISQDIDGNYIATDIKSL